MAGYGDDAGFDAWLTANGYDLPADAAEPAALRQRGSAYVDGLYGSPLADLRFSGAPTGGFAQERAWPRSGAEAYGTPIPDNVVPVAVIQASYMAAYQEGVEAGSLTVVSAGSREVKRIKASSVEIEYAGGSSDSRTSATPVLSAVEGLLAPFLIPIIPANGPAIWALGGRC